MFKLPLLHILEVNLNKDKTNEIKKIKIELKKKNSHPSTSLWNYSKTSVRGVATP